MGLTAVLGRRQSQKYGRENIYCLRDYLNHWIYYRNMSTKRTACESSEGNGNWKFGKEDSCYMKEILAEWCPIIIWKAELVNEENGFLSEKNFKQNVKGMTRFLLTLHSRMREERAGLMEEMLN